MNDMPDASLQQGLERWQRFAPCAGTNVSVHDAALGVWHGASGLADVARFYAALFAGELLQPSSLAAMRTGVPCGPESAPSSNSFFRRPAYGLGLMIDEGWAHGEFYGHGGDGPGFNTFAIHVPCFENRALTIVIFCNASMPRHSLRLCRTLLDVLSRDREDVAC